MRAVLLVHDEVPGRGERGVGSVAPALDARGFDLLVTSVGFGGPPLPAEADVLVVLGSVASAYDDTLPWLAAELAYVRAAVAAGTPVLGICFGGQLLARVLGGTVARAAAPEHGFVELGGETWFEFHEDAFTLPPGATLLAGTPDAVQAFTHGPHLGVQYHPEITPEVFTSWWEAWGADGRWPDAPALLAAITARGPACAADCAALVDRFLGGAQVAAGRSLH